MLLMKRLPNQTVKPKMKTSRTNRKATVETGTGLKGAVVLIILATMATIAIRTAREIKISGEIQTAMKRKKSSYADI